MVDKIKTKLKSPRAKQLLDIRSISLYIFGIIVLSVSWSGAKVIESNYSLQKKIVKLEQENDIKKLQNDNNRLRNKYLETDQFLELSARRQFGLSAPGETVLAVPKSVALSNSKDLTQTVKVSVKSELPPKPKYQANFEAWVDFLLHR